MNERTGRWIDADSLEREMTNRANARESRQGGNVNLWREPKRKHSHFFPGARRMSLCGTLELREDLVDPWAMKERTVTYCPECWKRFCGGLR